MLFQGKTFSIWKLSDLRAGKENDTISFFLFGDIYKEHWKQNEGMVIGLLNASIMPQRHVSLNLNTIYCTVKAPQDISERLQPIPNIYDLKSEENDTTFLEIMFTIFGFF